VTRQLKLPINELLQHDVLTILKFVFLFWVAQTCSEHQQGSSTVGGGGPIRCNRG